MGLLTIIRKQKLKDQELRVLILGLDNSGKSTILNSLLGRDNTNLKPTMGFEISSLQYHSHSLNFWDIGGQYSLRSFWNNFFNGSIDGIIFVISLVDDRIEDSMREFHRLILNNEQIGDVKVLIYLNKMDLYKGDVSTYKKMLVDTIGGERENFKLVECSGLKGENLMVGIDWLVDTE